MKATVPALLTIVGISMLASGCLDSEPMDDSPMDDSPMDDDTEEEVSTPDGKGDTAGTPAGSNVLPGPACQGTFTEAERIALYKAKPMTGTPAFTNDTTGFRSYARKLGPFSSAFYERSCDTKLGCSAWIQKPFTWTWNAPAADFVSSYTSLRGGDAFMWFEGSKLVLGVFSKYVSDGWCKGWVQGIGGILRTGDTASVTLAATERDNCPAGASPTSYFNDRDLLDPTGIVTGHCFKLTKTRKGYRTEIEPGRFVYDEYAVSYDASY